MYAARVRPSPERRGTCFFTWAYWCHFDGAATALSTDKSLHRGRAVNLAARCESSAPHGAVCLCAAVRTQSRRSRAKPWRRNEHGHLLGPGASPPRGVTYHGRLQRESFIVDEPGKVINIQFPASSAPICSFPRILGVIPNSRRLRRRTQYVLTIWRVPPHFLVTPAGAVVDRLGFAWSKCNHPGQSAGGSAAGRLRWRQGYDEQVRHQGMSLLAQRRQRRPERASPPSPGTCTFFLIFLADAPDPAPAPAQRGWVVDICGCSGCYTGKSRGLC
eukprot:gene23172-biopygen19316